MNAMNRWNLYLNKDTMAFSMVLVVGLAMASYAAFDAHLAANPAGTAQAQVSQTSQIDVSTRCVNSTGAQPAQQGMV